MHPALRCFFMPFCILLGIFVGTTAALLCAPLMVIHAIRDRRIAAAERRRREAEAAASLRATTVELPPPSSRPFQDSSNRVL